MEEKNFSMPMPEFGVLLRKQIFESFIENERGLGSHQTGYLEKWFL